MCTINVQIKIYKLWKGTCISNGIYKLTQAVAVGRERWERSAQWAEIYSEFSGSNAEFLLIVSLLQKAH